MATGRPTEPCVKISEIRNDSPTTPMNRPSRSTVPSPIAGSSAAPADPLTGRSGRDSGSLTKTSTAQTSVSAASPRKPAR